MNVLFLTLVDIESVEDRGIYQDLLRKFRNEGHSVVIVSPSERRKKLPTSFQQKDGVSILKVKTFNIQKTNVFEKGLGTLAIEYQYRSAIKKYLSSIKFDLVLYSTPPITFVKVIEFVKKRDNAFCYLLLKDIFPQNAVDMKMIKKNSFIHRQFVKKEKQLYHVSDTIGCMSPANVRFLLENNPEINQEKVEVNPNSIEPVKIQYTEGQRIEIRKKYFLEEEKVILVYGGNLGRPQGLDFLLETILATKNKLLFFLIIGDGTEFLKIQNWFETYKPLNAKLINKLPKDDYDRLLAACDIGMIFLDKDFQIPNFPSRLLSYLEMSMPVLAATDPNTDIGEIIERAECGLMVNAGNQVEMQEKLNLFRTSDLNKMGLNSEKLLYDNYIVGLSYRMILNRIS